VGSGRRQSTERRAAVAHNTHRPHLLACHANAADPDNHGQSGDSGQECHQRPAGAPSQQLPKPERRARPVCPLPDRRRATRDMRVEGARAAARRSVL